MSDLSPAIEVRKLTKEYGPIRAVDEVTFSVEKGQIVGFLGPNGAGKSTTMRILCGVTTATSGYAGICGIPVAARPDQIKRKIGYMPEHNPLPEDMRVVEYLRYRARLKDVPLRRVKSVVDEVMELCDLQRKARRKVIGKLSKGFRQRVGIADALLASPEVIIMDEPTIGLDPHQILGIRTLIDQLRGRMTVILSSHILPEIELSCDSVVIINQGRIVADGTPDALREEFMPRTRYHLRFIHAEVDIAAELQQLAGEKATVTAHNPRDGSHCFKVEVYRQPGTPEPAFVRAFSGRVDVELVEVAREIPSLEDVFLAATRRSWMESGMASALRDENPRHED